MEQLLLAYVFVCFSVGLACMGITVVVTHRTHREANKNVCEKSCTKLQNVGGDSTPKDVGLT